MKYPIKMITRLQKGMYWIPLLLWSMTTYAQSDMYIGTESTMMTFPQSQMAIFGNIINDGQGKLNHNQGGKVYIFRSPSTGNGNSRIMDGPLSIAPTDAYNAGGAYVRFFDLITDNTTGSSVPSGTAINTTSGTGHIQIEQEVVVSNTHEYVNGMLWTPREDWQHAFITYEDSATYTGVAPNNTFGLHVDGYVAYIGDSNFMFPIGDGIRTRMSGIQSPQNAIYKSAYFLKNPQLGTAGISGLSADTLNSQHSVLKAVSKSEFWDIDGEGYTKVVLTSYNSGSNHSNWASDFSTFGLGATEELTIAAWDDWENLEINKQPSGFMVDDSYTSDLAINPDLGGQNGSPYSAFTWAVSDNNSLGISDLFLSAINVDCHALLRFHTVDEEDMSHADVYRKEEHSNFEKIGTVALKGSTKGETNYEFEDNDVVVGNAYVYRVDAIDDFGEKLSSDPILLKIKCGDETQWDLYPNPSSGLVNIQSNYTDFIESVKVYDVIGQIVQVWELEKPESTTYFSREIDLSPYSRGMYHISLYDEKGKEVQSFSVTLLE